MPRERGIFVCGANRILADSMTSFEAFFERDSITGTFPEENRRVVV